MSKQLIVSSQIQAVLLTEVLLPEIKDGYYTDLRPIGHSAMWEGVEIVVADGTQVGPVGWVPMKAYGFLNPEMVAKVGEAKFVAAAQTVKPGITFKALKKELLELSHILNGRMTDKTVAPMKAFRGNNRTEHTVVRMVNKQRVITPAQAKASIEQAVKAVKKTVVKKAKADVQPAAVQVTAE